jgi:hypothetical protein
MPIGLPDKGYFLKTHKLENCLCLYLYLLWEPLRESEEQNVK